ncbi:TIGR02391 family protein [Paenarthrobacter ureafaciens]|uniref:TIGR02391 family protein n=1 Tax=Paenarthrobacter ureafaciens TaxID=37931 RepID=UPI003CF42497
MTAERLTWMLTKIDDMEAAVEALRAARVARDSQKRREVEQRLEVVMVPVSAIAAEFYDRWDWGYGRSYDTLMQKTQQLRGQVIYAAEIEEHLQPTAPGLHVDRLHPWIWQSAQSLWASGHYADAVGTAAKKINAELQNKVDRRDTSEGDLCAESFSLKEPTEKAARLRFEGDRTSKSWIARQEGALSFSRGAFMAIRNPLAHDGEVDLSEHEALEFLAIFSVIGRWIEECSVERSDDATATATQVSGQRV